MPFLGKMRFQHVYILCVYYEMLGVNHFSLSNCRSCCSFSAILWACSSANGPRPGDDRQLRNQGMDSVWICMDPWKKTTTQLQFSILQGRCSENQGFVDVVDSLLISFCISRSTRIFLDFTVPLSLPHWDQYPQLLPLTAAQELVRVKQAAPQTKSTSAATCNLSAVPQENPNITIMHQPWYPLVT